MAKHHNISIITLSVCVHGKLSRSYIYNPYANSPEALLVGLVSR